MLWQLERPSEFDNIFLKQLRSGRHSYRLSLKRKTLKEFLIKFSDKERKRMYYIFFEMWISSDRRLKIKFLPYSNHTPDYNFTFMLSFTHHRSPDTNDMLVDFFMLILLNCLYVWNMPNLFAELNLVLICYSLIQFRSEYYDYLHIQIKIHWRRTLSISWPAFHVRISCTVEKVIPNIGITEKKVCIILFFLK